ncbi:MAG: phage protease [Opitutaceae bacterium]|jgi:hypothetical protein|nr:phage protease [Opitutaceae bacterium]
MTTEPAPDTEILTPLLNREGEFTPAGWFHIVATGDHPLPVKDASGKMRRVIQRLDTKACEAIVADFANRRTANPGYSPLIDFEHFSHDRSRKSEASGWITAMENRADGIWFQANWSDVGESAIRNRRYRYISPVWFPHQCEKVSEGIYRPLRINDAGLTNKPNLHGLVPFWNREAESTADTGKTTEQPAMNTKAIALSLGLPETADEAAIIAAIGKLKDGAAQAAPLQNRLTELEKNHKVLLGDAVTKELDANKDVIPEGHAEAWKNRLESDFPGTSALLRGIKRPEVTTKTPIHQPGKGAAASAQKADGEGDQHPFLNRVDELMKADGKLTRDDAFLKAAEDNDLYESYSSALTGRE